MDYLQKIEEITQFVTNNPYRLSAIIPQIFPIALECRDYEGFCILYFFNTTLPEFKSVDRINPQTREEAAMLMACGLTYDQCRTIDDGAKEKYLALRSIDHDQVMYLSAKEMEDSFSRYNDLLSTLEIPNGLAPVDLYNRSIEIYNQKVNLVSQRERIDRQYSILHELVLNKLTYYRELLQKRKPEMKIENNLSNSKKVFVIHGHNEAKRRELVSILKDSFTLEPVVLSEQPDQGYTIIEKFEKYASECAYAFALFTPDDIISMDSGEQYFQARPNVIFELGWFYAKLGRNRVCILEQSSDKSKIFSDLQGVLRIQFSTDISEKYLDIAKELRSTGLIK